MKHLTKTEKETYELGKKLSKSLRGGEVIGLIGDLGTGKTAFSKGIAAGLGVKNTVTSPTFVIMKIYEGKKKLVHIDAYRLTSYEDLRAIGIEDYLNRKDTVIVIEWADRLKGELPFAMQNIVFTITDDSREISF